MNTCVCRVSCFSSLCSVFICSENWRITQNEVLWWL